MQLYNIHKQGVARKGWCWHRVGAWTLLLSLLLTVRMLAAPADSLGSVVDEAEEMRITAAVQALNAQIDRNAYLLKVGLVEEVSYVVDMQAITLKAPFISESGAKSLSEILARRISAQNVHVYVVISIPYAPPISQETGGEDIDPEKQAERSKAYSEAVFKRSKLVNAGSYGGLVVFDGRLSVMLNSATKNYEQKLLYRPYFACGVSLPTAKIQLLLDATKKAQNGVNGTLAKSDSVSIDRKALQSAARNEWVIGIVTSVTAALDGSKVTQETLNKPMEGGDRIYTYNKADYNAWYTLLSTGAIKPDATYDLKIAVEIMSRITISATIKDYVGIFSQVDKDKLKLTPLDGNFPLRVYITSSKRVSGALKTGLQLALEAQQNSPNALVIGMHFEVEPDLIRLRCTLWHSELTAEQKNVVLDNLIGRWLQPGNGASVGFAESMFYSTRLTFEYISWYAKFKKNITQRAAAEIRKLKVPEHLWKGDGRSLPVLSAELAGNFDEAIDFVASLPEGATLLSDIIFDPQNLLRLKQNAQQFLADAAMQEAFARELGSDIEKMWNASLRSYETGIVMREAVDPTVYTGLYLRGRYTVRIGLLFVGAGALSKAGKLGQVAANVLDLMDAAGQLSRIVGFSARALVRIRSAASAGSRMASMVLRELSNAPSLPSGARPIAVMEEASGRGLGKLLNETDVLPEVGTVVLDGQPFTQAETFRWREVDAEGKLTGNDLLLGTDKDGTPAWKRETAAPRGPPASSLLDNVYNSQNTVVTNNRNIISSASRNAKGAFGEIASDVFLTQKGYQPLHTRKTSLSEGWGEKGIDAIFKKNGKYYIVEAKYKGTATLGTLTDGTPQMSDAWITSSDRLFNATKSRQIAAEITATGYTRLLAEVVPDGTVLYTELNALGNEIGSFIP